MKKILVVCLCLVLCVGMVGCSGNIEDVSSLIEDTSSKTNLEKKLEDTTKELEQYKSENSLLQEEIEKLTGQINDTKGNSSDESSGGLLDPESGVLVYDDEYVTISYLGCEINKLFFYEEAIFYVYNKSNVELTIRPSSVSFDGVTIRDATGDNSVAPQSYGKVGFNSYAEESFPTMTPSSISGVIRVMDLSGTLFDKSKAYSDIEYHATFINVPTV